MINGKFVKVSDVRVGDSIVGSWYGAHGATWIETIQQFDEEEDELELFFVIGIANSYVTEIGRLDFCVLTKNSISSIREQQVNNYVLIVPR